MTFKAFNVLTIKQCSVKVSCVDRGMEAGDLLAVIKALGLSLVKDEPVEVIEPSDSFFLDVLKAL